MNELNVDVSYLRTINKYLFKLFSLPLLKSHVNTVAELANMRIEYDELRKKIKIFQASISNINNYYTRTQTESDKDRLLLIKEKEKLLYELKSLNLKTKTTEQIIKIKKMIKETELYLRKVNVISNNDITERLKINQERNTLIEQLKTTTQRMTLLEIHLKRLVIKDFN
jgi:protein KIBRA